MGDPWVPENNKGPYPVPGPHAKVLMCLVWEILGHLIGSTHKSPHQPLVVRLGGEDCVLGLVLCASHGLRNDPALTEGKPLKPRL